MVFDYKVKYNGKLYEIGEDVPMEEAEPKRESTTPPTEETKEIIEQKVEPVKKGRPSRKKA